VLQTQQGNSKPFKTTTFVCIPIMKTEIHTLANGLRLLHLPGGVDVAHAALYINAGTRDERPEEHGIAHFIEHAIFKGTHKRKAFHILNRLENVGGDLNAYTAKEETCIYASFLSQHMERAIELFADLVFNSVFPEKEIEKEKHVVIDEIDAYKDNPQEEIMDAFEDSFFEGHALGKRILGTKKSVKSLNADKIKSFTARHYIPGNMLLCTSGNVAFKKVIYWASKYIAPETEQIESLARTTFTDYIPFDTTKKYSNYQSHCIIGVPGYSMFHPKRTGLSLLNNLLGGPAMSSRLNMKIREKYGYTYIIESNYQTYTDAGLNHIYFGTEASKQAKVEELTLLELKNLRDKKLGSIQLHNARQQFAGQMAISAESNSGKMLSFGKHYLHHNSLLSMDELFKLIYSVTADELMEIANEIFQPSLFSYLKFVPKK
jgi:predicted Zn-dependent peptidase